MKVVVTGSRQGYSTRAIETSLSDLRSEPESVTVIFGGARGADRHAAETARAHLFNVVEVPAKWEIHGMKAGHLRNLEMLHLQPDRVIAYWNGESNGTRHCFQKALRCLKNPDHAIARVDIYL